MKMLFLKMTLFIAFSYSIGHAQVEREFCQKFYSPSGAQGIGSNSHLSISKSVSLLYKFVFRPSSLVSIEGLETNIGSIDKGLGRTVIDFITDVRITSKEKKRLAELTNEVKKAKAKLKKLGFQEMLKEAKSLEECSAVFDVAGIRDPIDTIQTIASDYHDLNEKETASKLFRLSRKKLKKFIKQGWEVISPSNFNEAHTYIKNNPERAVLILAHATPEGLLIDGSGKALPSGFFRSLSIDVLIVYSCYTEEVIKHYDFRRLKNIKNYHYPLPYSSWEKIVGNGKIPIEGLSSVLKIRLRKGAISAPGKECVFSTEKNNSSMGVFLNKTYIGELREEVSFPCTLLKYKNSLEVYSVIDRAFTEDLNLESIRLNSTTIFLKTYTSSINNRHIVSKGEF